MASPFPKRRRVTGSQLTEEVDIASDENVNVTEDVSPSRATYAAPTRASISRHNPNLLPGRDNVAAGDIRTEYATSSLRGPPRGLNPTALRPKMTAPRLSASPTRETSSSPSRRARTSHGSLTARSLPLALADDQSSQLETSEIEVNIVSEDAPRQERSLIEEENLAALVTRRGKRGRPFQAGLIPGSQIDDEEPDLPPTPVQLGLENKPRSPAGVLSSSPHGKAPGRRALPKSSPLKPRPLPLNVVEPVEAGDSREPGQNDLQIAQPAAQNARDEEEAIDDDPDVVERTQRLDQLSKQLQKLRSEVSFLQSQVMQHQERPNQPVRDLQLDQLVNILTTSSHSDHAEASPLKSTSVATRLSAFLPFARRPKPAPKDPLLSEEILPSYMPFEGITPLVHLQAFSGFSVSSLQQIEVIEAEGALLNHQRLILSASSPLDLDIDLALVSDTDDESIEQLSLQSITPWADAELGTWIRNQVEETLDMAVIGWGSSRYLDLARVRADCWKKCLEKHSKYVTSAPPTTASLLAKSDDIDNAEVSPLLGKVLLQLHSRRRKATLQISWNIDLDWIGDAESRISATATFPPRWKERDSARGSLGKIPEAFQMLIGKVGVFQAITVLVGLVLGPE